MPSLLGRCGGGGITAFQGCYTGNYVACPAVPAFGVLTFDTLVAGDPVLDISVPGTPTVKKTGNWAISIFVAGDFTGVSAGNTCLGFLQADDFGVPSMGGLRLRQFAPPTDPLDTSPILSMSAVTWLTAPTSTLSMWVGCLNPNSESFRVNFATITFLGGS